MTTRTQFFFSFVFRKVTARNTIISSISLLMEEMEQSSKEVNCHEDKNLRRASCSEVNALHNHHSLSKDLNGSSSAGKSR